MENTLKRLLAVETEAEQLVADANTQREHIVQQALQESRTLEEQFKTQLPEIQASFLKKAQARATQTIAEMNKRHEEKKAQLQALAEENQHKALEAAIQRFMQT